MRAAHCVSGHTEAQLAEAVILSVDKSHMTREGRRSAKVGSSAACPADSTGIRLKNAIYGQYLQAYEILHFETDKSTQL